MDLELYSNIQFDKIFTFESQIKQTWKTKK